MRIPEKGQDRDSIFETLEDYRATDVDWRSGRTWGYIYDPGKEAVEVGKQAYMMFLSENALDPTVFPSLARIETELVAMAAAHVGGDKQVVGNFTTGGTESIMLAVKTARDSFREKKPEVTRPEMILPETAHAAFYKAAHYMDVTPVLTRVDPETFKADADAVKEAITPNTILLVGSAPSYAHGVIDPISELGQLAEDRGLLFHVDACMGGFLLPYFRRLGEAVPEFGFSVAGVTSLSMDLHKYAYCPKGASLVLYRDKGLRRHQIFCCSRWAGYTVVNPTLGSTKPGGPLAAAWAVLRFIGDDGYLDLAGKKLECMKKLAAGVERIDGLRLQGRPEMSLVSIASDSIDVFYLIDAMKDRGWYIQPQLRFESSEANIHVSVNASNVRWVDDFLQDLEECVEAVRGKEMVDAAPMVLGILGSLDPREVSDDKFGALLAMAGVEGTTLPTGMAEINGILNSLPVALRERLVGEFINELLTLEESGDPES